MQTSPLDDLQKFMFSRIEKSEPHAKSPPIVQPIMNKFGRKKRAPPQIDEADMQKYLAAVATVNEEHKREAEELDRGEKAAAQERLDEEAHEAARAEEEAEAERIEAKMLAELEADTKSDTVDDDADSKLSDASDEEVEVPEKAAKATKVEKVSKVEKATKVEKAATAEADKKVAMEKLLEMCQFAFNASNTKYAHYELEVKFGTRGGGVAVLRRGDFDTVVRRLRSMGFGSKNPTGEYSLRIHPEFLDQRTGRFSNTGFGARLRVELSGIDNIQQLCTDNAMRSIVESRGTSVKLVHKATAKTLDDEFMHPADFTDYGFRATMNLERSLGMRSDIANSILDNWDSSHKTFRYLKRMSFVHAAYPAFQVDMSIVRTSARPAITPLESGVFSAPETVEIEIEVIGAKFIAPTAMHREILKLSQKVMGGLQNSDYPVSISEREKVIQEYADMVFKKSGRQEKTAKTIRSNDFIGPGLVALQLPNLSPNNSINIRTGYVVTEKVDGERAMMFVSDTGRIYLLTMEMRASFTGLITDNTEYFHTLLDGEMITHDSAGRYINVFAVFDVYFCGGRDVRAHPFAATTSDVQEVKGKGAGQEKKHRLDIVDDIMGALAPHGVGGTPMTIRAKKFYPTPGGGGDIFSAAAHVLWQIKEGAFAYHVDGLVYMPALLGVGGSKPGETGPNRLARWHHAFKWKPDKPSAQFAGGGNSIDFLVRTKKGGDGKDALTPIFEKGALLGSANTLTQFKTLELQVGFSPARHDILNPCKLLREGGSLDTQKGVEKDNKERPDYIARRFEPTDPADANAGTTRVVVHNDANNFMKTEEGEVFGDGTVVEFRYAADRPEMWRWVPVRVRADKTAEFRKGRQFGNDFSTANNNWIAIHYPVTEKMISQPEESLKGAATAIGGDDVYYRTSSGGVRRSGVMRDFHNLVVKRKLLTGITAARGGTLLDLACGKAGDLPKWTAARLKFVLGMDIVCDNLENAKDGACVRVLNAQQRAGAGHVPQALFVCGDATKNVRSGAAASGPMDAEVLRALFGTDANSFKDVSRLGAGVAKQSGVGKSGFDVVSMQFALHYMFQSRRKFYGFLRNVAECTKMGGVFVGTCFDGMSVFGLLRDTKKGDEVVERASDGERRWSIVKEYDQTSFPDTDESLGMQITVFQDSIGQGIKEWLVNFNLLVGALDKYGFVLAKQEEAVDMGLPGSSAMFQTLFSETALDGRLKTMTPEEKKVSFLNRYFVFKKVRDIDAQQMNEAMFLGEELEEAPEEKVDVATIIPRPRPPPIPSPTAMIPAVSTTMAAPKVAAAAAAAMPTRYTLRDEDMMSFADGPGDEYDYAIKPVVEATAARGKVTKKLRELKDKIVIKAKPTEKDA